jgi:hypothetical protein
MWKLVVLFGVILLLMVQCKVMFTLEFRILTVGGWADV